MGGIKGGIVKAGSLCFFRKALGIVTDGTVNGGQGLLDGWKS